MRLTLSSLLLVLCSFSTLAADADLNSNLHYYYPVPAANPPQTIELDVCAYGGSPGGVTAAIQAKRMGKTSALFVFNKHVGGLTSGGLTATDVGNAKSIGGMAHEFYTRVGKLRDFLPSTAENTFRAMLKDADVQVYYEHRLKSVKKDGNTITEIEFENGNKVKAKIFVDATYEGDLFAMAGISFHVGREPNSQYNETINGVQFHTGHNFVHPTDPYKIEGDPKSGLLWGITDDPPGQMGEGNKQLQAYNFRMILTNAPDRLPFPKPGDYDPTWYALLARYLKTPDAKGKTPAFIQLHMGDCNNEGAFSSDFIGGNYRWPEAGYDEREKIFQQHVKYQQGLMYFVSHDESIAKEVRDHVNQWGLNPNEFPDTHGWPHQLYIREGRRMISDYVMTQNNCQSKIIAEDSVGLGSYNMDSHNCRRIVVDGHVRNEGDVQIGSPHPYPIAYRSIVPKEAECANLMVPVCLSSSHISYGSIRMEPVFMILGQSAATAAVFAIDDKCSVQKVSYAKLHDRLIADKQIIEWDATK